MWRQACALRYARAEQARTHEPLHARRRLSVLGAHARARPDDRVKSHPEGLGGQRFRPAAPRVRVRAAARAQQKPRRRCSSCGWRRSTRPICVSISRNAALSARARRPDDHVKSHPKGRGGTTHFRLSAPRVACARNYEKVSAPSVPRRAVRPGDRYRASPRFRRARAARTTVSNHIRRAAAEQRFRPRLLRAFARVARRAQQKKPRRRRASRGRRSSWRSTGSISRGLDWVSCAGSWRSSRSRRRSSRGPSAQTSTHSTTLATRRSGRSSSAAR